MAAADLGASRSPNLSSGPPTRGDLRLVGKTLRRLDKLQQLCSTPRLGLRNSPPYLPQLLSETSVLLIQVWEPFQGFRQAGGQVPHGDEAEYLRIHIKNLFDKTERALLLFKEGRRKIYEETSTYRWEGPWLASTYTCRGRGKIWSWNTKMFQDQEIV